MAKRVTRRVRRKRKKKANCNAIVDMVSNFKEVERLIEIHSQVASETAGRKYAVQILNKSAIVLLVACWEAFVEDLASESLEFLILNADDHTVFPDFVLERVGSNCGGKNAWKLAGDGWKQALRNNLTEMQKRATKSLNTPKTAQVDELFKKTIGLNKLSSCWRWEGRSVYKKNAVDSKRFIYRLATKSANNVRTFIHSRFKEFPWATYTY